MDETAINQELLRLYGDVDWSTAPRCLHVAAIHGPSGRVVAVGEAAPRSRTDRFVLGFARARASVILTTGAILRAEPDLDPRYAEDEETDAAWACWRERILGVAWRPKILVLSGSGALPTKHPVLSHAEGWIFTTSPGHERLASMSTSLRVVIDEGGDSEEAPLRASEFALGEVMAFERWPDRAGSRATIAIEAGPTTAAHFYSEAAGARGIDELLLSRFEGELAKEAYGPPFIDQAQIEASFGPFESTSTVDEESGRWSFERYVRPRRDRT